MPKTAGGFHSPASACKEIAENFAQTKRISFFEQLEKALCELFSKSESDKGKNRLA